MILDLNQLPDVARLLADGLIPVVVVHDYLHLRSVKLELLNQLVLQIVRPDEPSCALLLLADHLLPQIPEPLSKRVHDPQDLLDELPQFVSLPVQLKLLRRFVLDQHELLVLLLKNDHPLDANEDPRRPE